MKTTMTLEILESGLVKMQIHDDKINDKIGNDFELNKSFAKVINDLQNFYTDNFAEGAYKIRMADR